MSIEQVGPGGVSNSYGARTTSPKEMYDNTKQYEDVSIPKGTIPLTATISDGGSAFYSGEYLFPFVQVKPGGDLSAAVAGGFKTVLLDANGAYTCDDLTLPARTTIVGRGATFSPSDTTHCCFVLGIGSDDVQIEGVKFLGQATSPNNLPYVSTHWAIKILRARRAYIHGNDFRHFCGGAIGAIGENFYTDFAARIVNNTVSRCFIGVLTTGYFEYSDYDNQIELCRVGMYSEAGNSNVSGKITKCRTPYCSANKAVDFTVGGVSASVGNSEHGLIKGLECNHSNDSGAAVWSSNSVIPLVGGGTYDPVPGVVFDGVLPPTITGLNVYYSNVSVLNRPAMLSPSYWVGGSASGSTITATNIGDFQTIGVAVAGTCTLINVSDPTKMPAVMKGGKYAVGYDGYVGTGDPLLLDNGYQYSNGNATVTGNSAIPGAMANAVYSVWTANGGADSCPWASEIQVTDNSTTINGSSYVQPADNEIWRRLTERGGVIQFRFRHLSTTAPAAQRTTYWGFFSNNDAAYFGNATAAYIGQAFSVVVSTAGVTTIKGVGGAAPTIGTLATLDTGWHDLKVTIDPRSLTAHCQLDAQAPVDVTLATSGFGTSGTLGRRIGWISGDVAGVIWPFAFSKMLATVN